MTDSPGASPRRRFIANIVGGTAALAVGASIPREIAAQGIPSYPPPKGGWDLSWADNLARAKHRAVLDCAEIDGGLALTNAAVYMAGWKEVYGAADPDLGVVLVIRHAAIQMALNDSIWDRWNLGELLGVKDRGEPARRNPFIGSGGRGGDTTLLGLMSRGVTVLCCNLALMRAAGQYASALKVPAEEARQSFIDALVPGIVRQTSGIFAVTRAQEAGAVLVKST